ncbi:TPA: hypothetical protein U1137_000329 [Streptococcus suis]|nr:hypothetical protein [Streptococcus suis]HEM4904854.1 hypothetical protein [Streptococcus suis]
MIKKYHRVKCELHGWLNCHYDYDQDKYSTAEAISDFIYSIIDDFKVKAEDVTVETVEWSEVE